MQLLGNKWQVSQDKISHFRMALLNPLTSQLFRRFISIKGGLYENNVLFWLEVEKYKVLMQLVCVFFFKYIEYNSFTCAKLSNNSLRDNS